MKNYWLEKKMESDDLLSLQKLAEGSDFITMYHDWQYDKEEVVKPECTLLQSIIYKTKYRGLYPLGMTGVIYADDKPVANFWPILKDNCYVVHSELVESVVVDHKEGEISVKWKNIPEESYLVVSYEYYIADNPHWKP